MNSLELDRLHEERGMLARLVDKLSAERDAAVAAREGIKRIFVDELLALRAQTTAAEKERDALRAAISQHRSSLSGSGLASVQDETLWRAAGLEV